MLSANRFLSLASPSSEPCIRNALAAELGFSPDLNVITSELAALCDPATGETVQFDFEVNRLALFNVIDVRVLQAGFSGTGERFDFVDTIEPGVVLTLSLGQVVF